MIVDLRQSERGTTLIETVDRRRDSPGRDGRALASMSALATMYTENHGHLEARTTEYAQDKMEQLLALVYTDAVSDTVTLSGGRPAGTGLAVGGSIDHGGPVNGYVDWLAQTAIMLGGGATPPADVVLRARVADHAARSTGDQADHSASHRAPSSAVGNALIPKSTVVALKVVAVLGESVMTQRLRSESGFSLMELIVATGLLLVVSSIVTSALLQMTQSQTTIWNRTEMHSGIRGATELLQQEVGQAGRISAAGHGRRCSAVPPRSVLHGGCGSPRPTAIGYAPTTNAVDGRRQRRRVSACSPVHGADDPRWRQRRRPSR